MLKINYGTMPEAIYNTSMYFDNVYLDSWITDSFAQQVIKSVDKGTVLSSKAIDSKALGVIPVTQLSGGTKTVLLIQNEPEKVFNASTCGDNCAKFILKIARKSDITINLYHMMDFGEKPFEIEVLNSHTIVHNMSELVDCAGIFLNGGDSL